MHKEPMAVTCPICEAQPGQACCSFGGFLLDEPHMTRLAVASTDLVRSVAGTAAATVDDVRAGTSSGSDASEPPTT